MRQLVQTLQAALEKEKIKVKDLTEQVNTLCNSHTSCELHSSCLTFPVPLKRPVGFSLFFFGHVCFVQVAEANLEAAHNRRHYRAAMLELSEIKKDLHAKEELVKALQKEAKMLT